MCKNSTQDKILRILISRYGCIVKSVKNGNFSYLTYYLEMGGNPNKICESTSLLESAIQNGSVEMVKILSNHKNIEVRPKEVQLVLKNQGYVNNQEMAFLLICKAKPQSLSSAAILETAYFHHNKELFRYLLVAGAKVPITLIKTTLLLRPSKEDECLGQVLREAIFKPKRLKNICRLCIRSEIGKISDISKLKLPKQLSDFCALTLLWLWFRVLLWLTNAQ